MKCEDALERMLEADPAALRSGPSADPELSRHVGTCARCRDVARALVAELDELDRSLAVASAPGLRQRHRMPVWVPLAVAAVLATVLILGREPGPRLPSSQAGAVPDPARPAAVAVTLPADRGAAVMKTTNPKITVVWLYERSER